jgi:hypothetical protein
MASRNIETSLLRLHEIRFIRLPESRLWVLRAIYLLKSTLNKHRPSRFFINPGFRKWLAFGHFETMSHRLLQNRFLRRPEGSLWILRRIRVHKTSLKWLRSFVFSCPGGKNDFDRPFDTLKHRFIEFTKVLFKTSRGQIMSSQVLSSI